jgi:dTDP-3-amino-3,4,6-trideoxy-alpha-D-glucose transaminase
VKGPAAPQLAVPFGTLADDYRSRRSEIDAAIRRVLESGRFILGPEVEAFEAEFAAVAGRRFAVACNSGTDALAIALKACGAGEGDEVLLPANACVPVMAAVRLAGATPRLADVDPDTLTLDEARARAALSEKTKFLMAVHLYGGPADLEGLARLAAASGATLLEDCAQSHGASLAGRPTGSFGRAAGYSFYPTKNLGAYGDGGAVVTEDSEVAARAREIRQYGWRTRDVSEREGCNSRLDEIQAAILRAKLPGLSEDNARRRRIAQRYDEALADLPVRRLAIRAGGVSVRHLYPIRAEKRDVLRDFLAARGVETAIHYPLPLHLQPAYAFLGHREGDFPVSEEASRTLLSLPIYPTLTDEQIEAVVAGVRAFFGART